MDILRSVLTAAVIVAAGSVAFIHQDTLEQPLPGDGGAQQQNPWNVAQELSASVPSPDATKTPAAQDVSDGEGGLALAATDKVPIFGNSAAVLERVPMGVLERDSGAWDIGDYTVSEPALNAADLRKIPTMQTIPKSDHLSGRGGESASSAASTDPELTFVADLKTPAQKQDAPGAGQTDSTEASKLSVEGAVAQSRKAVVSLYPARTKQAPVADTVLIPQTQPEVAQYTCTMMEAHDLTTGERIVTKESCVPQE